MLEPAIPPSVRAPCPPPASSPRRVLTVAILGSSMAFLDGTVVNVALPVMQRDLGASVDRVQWIVEAYALLLGSLVLVGGALGDRLGRRRVFLAGVVLFALASMGCGLAPDALTLIGARAVQGIGAALLVPGSLSLITAAYPESSRGKAIGTWSAFTAIMSAAGPIAGGAVIMRASWRWLFFFNVPIAAAVIALAWRGVAETRDASAPQRMDWIGAGLVTTGLGLIVYALIDSGRAAGSAGEIALLAAGALALAAFVVVEARISAPMVPLSLFRSRTFSGTNLLTLLLYAALGAALFFLPFNLIQIQRYTPAAAGAALLPFVLIISALSPVAGAVSARFGARLPLVVGPLVAGAGFSLLAVPTVGGSYWSTFFPGITVLGIGMGITVAPLTTAVMGSVGPRHAGVASGVNNAVSRAAGLLAVAALGVLLRARFNRALDAALGALSLPAGAADRVAVERQKLAGADFGDLDAAARDALRDAFDRSYIAGFRALMIASALLSALGAVAALGLVEKAPGPAPEDAER